MKNKHFIVIICICVSFMIISMGCGRNAKDNEITLDLTTPEKTIDICMKAIKEADKEQLKRISLIHYAEQQKSIEDESEAVRKAYYTDCIAKELHNVYYESAVNQLSSIYRGADFLAPQRIVGGSEQEICYKVDIADTENTMDEKSVDLWITLVKAKNENWYVGGIDNKAICDWFGNEEVTEEASVWAKQYLEETENDALLDLFENISATQLNGDRSWSRGFENTMQISLKGIACFYIHLQTEEELQRLYDSKSKMYRIPIEGIEGTAYQYLIPNSNTEEEAIGSFNIFQQNYDSWEFEDNYDSELDDHVFLAEKEFVDEVKFYPSENMSLKKKEVLPDGTIYLEAVCYETAEKKKIINNQQLKLWIPQGDIRYRSYHVIPIGWEEEGNQLLSKFALMKLGNVQVGKRLLDEEEGGHYFEEDGEIFREMLGSIHITGEYEQDEISEESLWSERFIFQFNQPDNVVMEMYVGKDLDKEFLSVTTYRVNVTPAVNGEQVSSYTGNGIPLLETEGYERHFYQCDNLNMVKDTVKRVLEMKKQEEAMQ